MKNLLHFKTKTFQIPKFGPFKLNVNSTGGVSNYFEKENTYFKLTEFYEPGLFIPYAESSKDPSNIEEWGYLQTYYDPDSAEEIIEFEWADKKKEGYHEICIGPRGKKSDQCILLMKVEETSL